LKKEPKMFKFSKEDMAFSKQKMRGRTVGRSRVY
jgi:hypothetical protein